MRRRRTFLDGWPRRARDSKLESFHHLCEQRNRWRDGLLNCFVHRVANGLAEAISSNSHVLKRAARGFRDLEYFMLQILQRCGNLSPLAQVAGAGCEPLPTRIEEEPGNRGHGHRIVLAATR